MIVTAYRDSTAIYGSFTFYKVTDIYNVISYKYTKRFWDVGDFTLVIPANEPTVGQITTNMILSVDNTDYYIVKSITTTEREVTITGYDLKYLLSQRITLFPAQEAEAGTYGYDVVQGSTEACIKHYVDYNIVSAADSNRRISGLTIAENQDRGLDTDTYMSRLEPLSTVVGNLCKNADIGYNITLDFSNSSLYAVASYVFDVCEGVDRTESQHENNSVVFAQQFCNITAVKREVGTGAEKNALYAINGSNSSSSLVKLTTRGDSVPRQLERCETSVTVSCDVNEMDTYALKEAESMIATDSFEVDAYVKDYGTLFSLGDKVTFKFGNLYLDTRIIEVQFEQTADNKSLKLVTGDKKPKTLNSLAQKAASTDAKVKSSAVSSTTALRDFTANSDGSYTLNGMKYTGNYDTNGRLIWVSDENGNVYQPDATYAATNTNIDYNTLFMATALARGISGVRPAAPVEFLFEDNLKCTGTDGAVGAISSGAAVVYDVGRGGKCYSARSYNSLRVKNSDKYLCDTFTAVLWFRLGASGLANYPRWRRLVTFSGYNSAMWIEVTYNNSTSTGKLQLIDNGNGQSHTILTTAAAYNDGKWHSLVYTQSNGTVTLTVDGVTVSGSSYFAHDHFTQILLSDSSYALNGDIDSLRVYNRALTADELIAVLSH